MCFSGATPPKKKLETSLGPRYTVEEYEALPKASGFDHPVMPVATVLSPYVVGGMTWGFIPAWVRTPEDAAGIINKTLNARSETIYSLPSFREAAEAGQRCLLFLDGFYETQHVGKEKIPHFITDVNESPLAVGGLWNRWTERVTGTVHEGFTIITTPANELLAEIHNKKERMPLILQPELWEEWMNPKADEEKVQRMMKPLPDGLLKATPLRQPPPTPPTLF